LDGLSDNPRDLIDVSFGADFSEAFSSFSFSTCRRATASRGAIGAGIQTDLWPFFRIILLLVTVGP
jgi:hypothetical protein